MMKNLPAKLLVLAVMATLITTTLVSGTFAKYVTSFSASDTVRVAKFDVKLTDGSATITDTIDVFSTADTRLYNGGVGADGKKIIAPGTTGDFELQVDNLSEVKVKVGFELEETNGGSVPIYYTIGSDTQKYSDALSGADYESLSAMATALAIASIDASNGTTAESSDPVTINWAWDFYVDDDRDSDDTDLGTALTLPTVELTVKVTAEQLDA